MLTDNVEKIIQVAGIVFGILGAIGGTVAGLILMDTFALLGFIIVIVSLISSLISFAYMYGFGVIIEKVKEIAKNTKTSKQKNYKPNVKIKQKIFLCQKVRFALYLDMPLQIVNNVNFRN